MTVSVSSNLSGLTINNSSIEINAEAIAVASDSQDLTFTINRAAALASDQERVITVTAQDGVVESGQGF